VTEVTQPVVINEQEFTEGWTSQDGDEDINPGRFGGPLKIVTKNKQITPPEQSLLPVKPEPVQGLVPPCVEEATPEPEITAAQPEPTDPSQTKEKKEETLSTLDGLFRQARQSRRHAQKLLLLVDCLLKDPELRQVLPGLKLAGQQPHQYLDAFCRSIAQLEPEVEFRDLLNAMAAVQVDKPIWPVYLHAAFWPQVVADAIYQAGFRLARALETHDEIPWIESHYPKGPLTQVRQYLQSQKEAA
jgi:hypothetical protein